MRLTLLLLILAFALNIPPDVTAWPGPDRETGTDDAVALPAAARCLSMATSGDWSTSFKGKVMGRQLKQLDLASGGALTIKLYDRSRLGDDGRLIAGVQQGTIDLVQSTPTAQIRAVPEVALLDVPGLLSTLEEWNALLDGPYRQELQGYYRDAGLQLIEVFAFSFRQLTSAVPVRGPEDLEGLRVRTTEDRYQEAFWNGLGAVAVPCRSDELYFSLYEGSVQAQEGLVDAMLTEDLVQVQHCITFTAHQPMISVIAMNLERYEQLAPQEQTQLEQFTAQLEQSLIDQMAVEEGKLVETLSNDYGITMIEPSPQLQRAVVLGRETVLELLRQDLGQEKVDRFLAAVADSRQG